MASSAPFSILSGYYATLILHDLHRAGALQPFEEGAAAPEVAARFSYDPAAFHSVVEYLRRVTDLVLAEPDGRYRLNPDYLPYSVLAFQLDKFVGAYGGLPARAGEALRSPGTGHRLVDEGALADAFGRLDDARGMSTTARLLHDWGVRSLLDMGCGTAALLRELCRLDPDFHGLGVERNPAMCRLADERLQAEGLADRVRIVHGEVFHMFDLLTRDDVDAVGALCGRSLLNEFFGFRQPRAVEWLRLLARRFPGRPFFVSDYYGRLSRPEAESQSLHSLLQDVVQVLSGQGVPPPDHTGWSRLYEAAGWRLVHVYNGEHDGIDWFIHILLT